MKLTAYIPALLAGTLAACVNNSTTSVASTGETLGWLDGCWQTDGGVEETWVRSKQGDQLFGYSVTSKSGQRVFFEQLRIDLKEKQATLFAYPRGIGPTSFEGTISEPFSIEFVNAENDYPQRIRYAAIDGNIEATIALLDNTNANSWNYQRCN